MVPLSDITEVDYIWKNGELVPWAEATTHVLSHSLHYGLRRVRGHSLLQGARRGQILRVPPARPYGTAASQLQDCPDRVALQRRRADGRHVGSHPCQQASGLLYPPIGIPRLRRHGGRPDRGARGRRHRRVALGRLPGRRRAGKRRGRGHLLVAPALEQRHSAGGEGHGLLHELHPREDGGEGPRLCPRPSC